jgi:hypothetical protein
MALVLAFAAVGALSTFVSALRNGWKGIFLVIGVALVLVGSHYNGCNNGPGVAAALGCMAIGSSATLVLKETVHGA